MLSKELKNTGNELFNSLLKAISDNAIISVTDNKGKILKINELFCEISQYSENELLGKTHQIINSGIHPKEFWVDLWQTISKGEIWYGEITNRAKDGSLYFVKTTIYPIKNEESEIESYVSVRYDITNLKKAELNLKETNYMFKSMLDSVTDGNVFFGLDYKIYFINFVLLNYCQDFFVDSKIEAGDDIRTKLPKEILNLFLEICENVKKEKSVKFEREIIFPNDENRYIEFNFNLIENKLGNPIGIGVFIVDNTKQRKNEREILNTKNLLSSISNSTNQIYFFLDPDKKLLYFNESARLTLYQTYNRNPTIGENFTDYFDVDNLLNDFIDCFEEALNGKELKVSKEWGNSNGNVLWFSIRYYPVKNEKDEIIGVAINIDEFTEEKKTELELLRFKDLLELTNANAKIGNWEFDITTQKIFWTDEVYRIFEIDKEQEKLYETYLSKIHPEDLDLLNSKVELAIKERESYNIIHRIKLNNGVEKYILGLGYPVLNEKNEVVAIAGTVQDITESKQLENELYESQLELKAILDSSTESNIFVSPDFKIISYNKHAFISALKIFNKELVKNDDFLQFFPPHEVENFKLNFNKALNGEQIKIEKKIEFGENLQIWLEVNYHPVRNFENNIIGVSFVVDEISKRKLQEIELLKTKDLLNQSQKIAKLGGWELDIKSGNLLWTDETYRIHETSPEEFNPTVDAGVGYFLPDSKATIEKALEEAINQGKGYDLYLETYTTKGNKIDVRTTCEVIFENEKPSKLRGIFQDITVENEIKNKLNLLVSQIDGMVFSITDYPNNSKYWISDGSFELTGYGKEYFYNDNLFFSSLISEEDNLRMINAMDYCFNTKQPYEVKYKLKHKTKGWIDVLEKGKAKLNEKDEQVTIEGIIIDISNAIQEEKKQKERDKIFKLITENSADCLVLHDLDGNYQYLSPSSKNVFGYESEELLGKNLSGFLHNDEKKYIEKSFIDQIITDQKTISLEYRFKNKEGKYIWLEASINVVIENDKPKYIQCVNRDISIRKRYEELLNNTERLGKIGSWEKDLLTNEVIWSNEIYTILNIKKVKDVSYKFIDFVHPDDIHFFSENLDKSIKSKTSNEIIFRLLVNKKVKHVKKSWDVIKDIHGKPIKLAGSLIDITEMYLLQEELKALNMDLEAKVEKRTNELMIQKEKSIQLEKEKSISETNYKLLFDYIPVGIAFVTPLEDNSDFIINDFNKKGLEIDKKKVNEVIGKKLTEVYPEIGKTELFKELQKIQQPGATKQINTIFYKDENIEGWRESAFYKLQSNDIIIVFNDVTEDALLKKKLNESIKEKEILLDEIHHRVKNNLQVVIGLMNMQQNTLGDEKTKLVLKESERRVRAMSLIHELIYQKKNYKEIAIQDYISNLYNYISESFSGKRVCLKTDIQQVQLSISTATSLGIIITEIITNSFKYAFEDNVQNEEIFISIKKIADSDYILTISDNGKGFKEEIDLNNLKTLGMSLINGLVNQLKGSLSLTSNSTGTQYVIHFYDNKK
jgi:PAS domain S-box-containing protein